jgi:hypothetical protein
MGLLEDKITFLSNELVGETTPIPADANHLYELNSKYYENLAGSNVWHVYPGQSVQAAVDAAVAAGITYVTAMAGEYTENLVLPAGVKINPNGNVRVVGDVELVSRDQIEGVEVTGRIYKAAPTLANPVTASITTSTTDATVTAIYAQTKRLLESLGITVHEVTMDADTGVLSDTTPRDLLFVIGHDIGESTGQKLLLKGAGALGAYATRRMGIMYGTLAAITSGTTCSTEMSGPLSGVASIARAHSYYLPGGGAETAAPYTDIVNIHTPNGGSIYSAWYIKHGATKSYLAWISGNGYGFAAVPSTPTDERILGSIGLLLRYLAQAAGSLAGRILAIPQFITIDDTNAASSTDCIDAFAATIRATNGGDTTVSSHNNGGVVIGGWGSDTLIAGGSNDAGATSVFQEHPSHAGINTSWGKALDVVPQILHDHSGYGRGFRNATLTPDEIAAHELEIAQVASAWAGFNLPIHVRGFCMVAWNTVSTNAITALRKLGVRVLRKITASSDAYISITDADGTKYIRNTATGASTGDPTEALGPYLPVAFKDVGPLFATHQPGASYRPTITYYHGPQFAANNVGGIRGHIINQNVAANDTVSIGASTWTFKASGASGNYEVNVGASLAAAMSALADAINAASTADTLNITAAYVLPSGGLPTVLITPASGATNLTIDVSATAIKSLSGYSCVASQNVADELLKGNVTRYNDLANVTIMKFASLEDFASL